LIQGSSSSPVSFMNVYEPQRAKYRKKIGKWKICEFCNPKNATSQECKTISGKHWKVWVNLYPYMDGNLMLIPRRHIKDINELNSEEKKKFFCVLEKVKKKLGEIFETKEFNIGLNLGKNSGSSIEHMHWQIIPRKYRIDNAANIFADIHVITMLPSKLKKIIDKK
jgi:ATP adenylyltransferase